MQKIHANKGMGVLEKIYENIESTEAKKNSLRKSLLMLMVDWRDFEKRLETSHKCLVQCLNEHDSKEKHLNSVQESVCQSSEELRLMRKSIEEKFKEVEDKEKELISLQEKGMRELELKEEEWLLKKEEYVEEFRKREVKLSEKEKAAEGLFGKLEIEKNEILGMDKLVEERLREVGLKEEFFEERRREFEKRVSELDDRERKVKERDKRVHFGELGSLRVERERAMELKEKEVILIREDLELKEKELEFERAVNEKREKELDVREKLLEARKKQYEITMECLEEAHLKEKECLLEKELLERGNIELELKRKEFEDRVKGVKDLEMREKQLEKEKKELEMREMQLEKEKKELEVREKQLTTKKNELEVTQESLNELQLIKKECQLEKELLEIGNKELELKKKEFGDRIKEFDLKEKELELKEKKLNDKLHACLKIEPGEKVVDEKAISNSSSCPHFIFAVELDGLDFRMFLNEREMNLESADEVFKDLQSSGDPVYLVLNAMETLCPPYLRKVDMEFEGRVARSCILLLEQLIRISPRIQSSAKNEALKLASEWKAMIKTENSWEVLGFLYLLASFDLGSAFDVEEVMNFFKIVAQHQQTPGLCRRLGFTDKIPGLIQNLVRSKRGLDAIRFIYAFELVDHFPPVPILKNYLKHVKKTANTVSKNKCNTKEAQDKAIDKKIDAMRAVIKCIADHKLESQYSPKILEGTIQQLLREKVHEKHTECSVGHKPQDQKVVEGTEIPSIPRSIVQDKGHDQQKVDGKGSPSATAPNCIKTHNIASDLSNTDIGPSHAMALILANMDGKSLLSFLNSHLVEHELLQNEVSTAFQISDDAAKIVLDAVEGFCGSHPQEQDARSCIFLLEQLMRLSPHIVVDVKETAQKIAVDWKAKIRAETESPSVVLGFLLFVSTFKLSSTFDAVEIMCLYKRVVKHKHVPGLCQALGISRMISESRQARSESLQLNVVGASSSDILANHVKYLCKNVYMEGEERVSVCSEIPMFIENSLDPAQLVLDALWNCYFSNFKGKMISPLVAKSFFHLLKQLMSISPEIKPRVKERASKFAGDWKSRLTGTNSWEVLGFLQLLASYELSSSFSADELLGLLEVSSQLKDAIDLFRILGLEDKVPGFIFGLTKKKQLLLAFEYVYEFNLVDKIPPVALLKKHVSYSRLVAKKICDDGQNTPEAQDKAMANEISALKSVIKSITDHGLQSEYSPDQLRERVAQLESRRVNLKTSLSAPISQELLKLDMNNELPVVPKAQVKQEDTKKRPLSCNAIINDVQLPPPSKSRRLAAPPEAAQNDQLANGRYFDSVPPFSRHPGCLYT